MQKKGHEQEDGEKGKGEGKGVEVEEEGGSWEEEGGVEGGGGGGGGREEEIRGTSVDRLLREMNPAVFPFSCQRVCGMQ